MTYSEQTIQLSLIECFYPANDSLFDRKAAYTIYKDMIYWLETRNIPRMFLWNDNGQFYPTSIVLDVETAVMFRLRYNV